MRNTREIAEKWAERRIRLTKLLFLLSSLLNDVRTEKKKEDYVDQFKM